MGLGGVSEILWQLVDMAPVFLDAAAEVGTGDVRPSNLAWGALWRPVWSILAFVFVVGLAYFVTKRLARSPLARRSANLGVLEATPVSQHSNVQIVKAGTRLFLIGVTRETVTLIAELNEDDLTAGTLADSEHTQVFKTPVPLEKYLSVFKKSDKNEGE